MKENPDVLNAANMKVLAIGNVIAFVVAFFAMKMFVDYLKKYGFKTLVGTGSSWDLYFC